MSDRRKELEELLLRADWDDAPERARRGRSKHTRLWLSVLVVCIAFGAVANYLDSKQLVWNNSEASATVSPVVVRSSSPDRSQSAAISQPNSQQTESYDEQINRLLGEPVASPSTPEPRQTVFNDANYVPAAQVNTISMAQPRSAIPAQPPGPNPEYVTVVNESKPSCLGYKQGSIECRRFKKVVKRIRNQQCYHSEHNYSAACRSAELYNPVK